MFLLLRTVDKKILVASSAILTQLMVKNNQQCLKNYFKCVHNCSNNQVETFNALCVFPFPICILQPEVFLIFVSDIFLLTSHMVLFTAKGSLLLYPIRKRLEYNSQENTAGHYILNFQLLISRHV